MDEAPVSELAGRPSLHAVEGEVATLANGLRVVTTPLPQSQAACLAAYVGVGSRDERRKTLGLSHYLEHMLFKGTEARPTAIEISTAIEGAGGTLNAFTTRELTSYWNRVPYDKLELAMDILADSVRFSTLEPEEIERERTVIQQEIRRAHDQPGQRASQLLSAATYGTQPLGWEIAGDLGSVEAITREDLGAHIDTWYRPENVVLSVAGQVEVEQVNELAERLWGDMRPASLPETPAAEEGIDPEAVRVEPREIEQCNLAMALRTFPRLDPDRYALSLLNGVLGRGMSSRLFVEVRERRGLAYSVGSHTSAVTDTGHMGIAAGVTKENVVETAKVVLDELRRLTAELVDEVELTKAREHAVGSFRLSLETASAYCHRAGGELLGNGRIEPLEDVLKGYAAVTAEDVRRVAQRFVRMDNVAMAVVGPFDDADALRDLLAA